MVIKRLIHCFLLICAFGLLVGCEYNVKENNNEVNHQDQKQDDKQGENPGDNQPIEVKKNFEGIVFENKTFDYDNESHCLTVENCPQEAIVTYSNNNKTAAGDYQVTATIEQEGYHTLTLTATLSIVGNFSNVTFEDVTVPYDGKKHSIEASNVPSFASVTYTGTKNYTEPGTYEIKVLITASHYTDKRLTATLTILPLTFDGLVFDSSTILYDGVSHKIEVVGSPQEAKIVYEVNNKTVENSFLEVGKYNIKATVSLDHYQTEILTAELEIVSPIANSIDHAKEYFHFDNTLKWDDFVAELSKGNFTLEVTIGSRFDYNDGSVRNVSSATGTYAYDGNKIFTSYEPVEKSKYDQPQYTYERIVQDKALVSKVYFVQNKEAELYNSTYDLDSYFENKIQEKINSALLCLEKTEDGGFKEGSYFSSVTNYGSFEIKDNTFIIHIINNYYHPEGSKTVY